MTNKNIALIDIGSNSIRLVIFQFDRPGHYQEIQNLKVVARLSSHIDTYGYMTESGISKLLESLRYFQEITRTYKLVKVKCIATAAIRNAHNQKEILDIVNKMTDFSIRVLSEYEEAFFGFLAITNSTNINDGISIDIGGGSTEITLFKGRRLMHFHSFPFGAITLKQKFISSELPTNEEKNKLKSFLQEQFSSLKWLCENQDLPLVGIGGSARNLSLISQRKTNYPLRGLHQYEMSSTNIFDITNDLKNMSLKQRQMVDGLSKDRADIIIPAAEAICTLMEVANTTKFFMSNKGLRDGLFYEELFLELNIEQYPNVVEESFNQLTQDYSVDLDNVKYLSKLVTQLFYELKIYYHSLTEEDLRLLHLSCRVLYIGEFINHEASSENTFYLLTNKSIEGLTHIDRLKIALIASFKSKSFLNSYVKEYKNWFKGDEIEKLELLGAMLKFSYALNRTGRKVVTELKITEVTPDHTIKLKLFFTDEPYFEQIQAQKYKKHLEKALQKSIELMFSRFD